MGDRLRVHRPLFVPLQRDRDGNLHTRFHRTTPNLYLTIRGARDSLSLFGTGEVRLVDLDMCPTVAPVGEELADAYLRAESNCQLWGAEVERVGKLMEGTIGGALDRPPVLTPAPLLAAAVKWVRSKCLPKCGRLHVPKCPRGEAAAALRLEAEAASHLIDAGVPL